MLAFINTPTLARSLALRSLDEGAEESRPRHRGATGAPRRAGRATDRTGRRSRWLAKSLRLAH